MVARSVRTNRWTRRTDNLKTWIVNCETALPLNPARDYAPDPYTFFCWDRHRRPIENYGYPRDINSFDRVSRIGQLRRLCTAYCRRLLRIMLLTEKRRRRRADCGRSTEVYRWVTAWNRRTIPSPTPPTKSTTTTTTSSASSVPVVPECYTSTASSYSRFRLQVYRVSSSAFTPRTTHFRDPPTLGPLP